MAEVKLKQTKSAEIIAKVNSAITKMKLTDDLLQESEDVLGSMEISSGPISNPDQECVSIYKSDQKTSLKLLAISKLTI